MKFTCTLLFTSVALAQNVVTAQTPAPAKPQTATHATATAHAAAAAHACITVPALSPKIPALPAGAPCAKPLYTLTTVPNIKIDYASPQEGAALRDILGIEPSSFSLGYIDTKIGTGELAAPHKWYSIQYTGYLVDGTKFDSSYDHPEHEAFVFAAGQHQVIAGWDTGFAGMRVGGKRRLFIPFQLAYGPAGHGAIPPKAELIFDLEFIAQSDEKPAPKTPPTPPANEPPYQPAPKPATPPPAAGQPTSTPQASAATSPASSASPATAPAAAPPKPQ
jgi:peptidylprolyl isomerase